MTKSEPLKRVAYSPGEFAELFGKSQTWGYRQIYDGKVIAITQHGRILIPAKEVERILESAGIYNGMEKSKQAKARVEKLTPEQKSIWQRFVESRRTGTEKGQNLPDSAVNRGESARNRVASGWGKKRALRG
jgi:hypothetical protein